jgi:hypothetical protein
MGWRELKSVVEWGVVPIVVLLFYVPWTTLIRWAKEEAKSPRKDVL